MTEHTNAPTGAGAGHLPAGDHKLGARPGQANAATAAGGGQGLADTQGIGAPADETRREAQGRATTPVAPMETMPAPQNVEGHASSDAHCSTALDAAALMELQVRRKAYIQHIGAAERRLGALARRAMGWRWDMAEAERARINKRAARLTAALLAERAIDAADTDIAASAGLIEDVEVVRQSREPLLNARKAIEKEMEAVAARLPAAGLVTVTRGFGMRGLAVIVGEAGNLSDYANPAKLWKRLGLAPHNGRAGSTWRMKGGLSAEEWATLGYNPGRLGQLYGVVTEPLMKANDGKYRALYLAAKARFTAEGKAERPAHAHKHAMRVMTKEITLDCWRAWRGLPPRIRQIEHPTDGDPLIEPPHAIGA